MPALEIVNGEGKAGLENGYAAQRPVAKEGLFRSGGMREKSTGVADRETLRAIEIGNTAGGVDVALIVVGGVEGRVAGGGCVDVFGESVGGLQIVSLPAPETVACRAW